MWLVHVQSLKNAARSMHLLNITSPQIIQSAFSLQKTPVKHPAWEHLIFCQPRRPQGTCNCWLQGHKQKHRSFCLCTWEQKKKKGRPFRSSQLHGNTSTQKSGNSTIGPQQQLLTEIPYLQEYHSTGCFKKSVLCSFLSLSFFPAGCTASLVYMSENLIKYRRHHSDAHGSSLHSSHLRQVVTRGSLLQKIIISWTGIWL